MGGVGVGGVGDGSSQQLLWQQAPQYASVVPQYPHWLQHIPLEHGLLGPQIAFTAEQLPGLEVAAVVVVELDVEAIEVAVSVAPVQFDVLVLVFVLVVDVDVGGLIPSQSLEIFTSAQFQNCSAARVTSTGCEQVGRLPGSKKGGNGY